VANIRREIIKTKRMNPFSWMLNDWYICFQVLSLVLLAGTVLTGAGALITGLVLSKRQNLALEEQRQKTEEQRGKTAGLEKQAADAQLSLLKLQRFIREPRTVEVEKSRTFLANRPKGSVRIKYLDGVEPERLANELNKTLTANGWQSSIQKVGADVIHDAGIALLTSSKGLLNGGLDESGRPKFFEEPGQTLFAFLDSCVDGAVMGWSATNSQLEENSSVVLIGPKVW
jgi:hypothetical protein